MVSINVSTKFTDIPRNNYKDAYLLIAPALQEDKVAIVKRSKEVLQKIARHGAAQI